ncbi:MDR family MFS transporter [Dictyobacter aurantiacus]|uniref:MFS transporter n=1 Tax=Dictyobacter aurantiacus TaxID=1936993 RepID=A0A401ZKH9_9CHLR|nr:MFS transporter [Dictyobacter aurantiacus]GCE07377.1 MFS transporter [Dictyobacter aurantiacus]
MQKAFNFPRALWIIFAGTFINRFGSVVSVFLVFYMLSKGYTAVQAGIAASAYGIGSIGAAALGGYLADRLGRRYTLMLSTFSSAATMLLLSQATTLPLIVALVTLAGLTTELYRPASGALIADLVEPQQRVSAFAAYRLAINLGVTAGSAVAGFIASRSFLLLFVGDAATSAIFGLLVLFALPAHVSRHASQQQQEHIHRGSLWSDYSFLLFLLAGTAIAFVYMQQLSTLALQVKALGFSSAIYGLLGSLNGLIVVFLELPISAFTQRFSKQRMVALGFLLIALGFGLTGLASTVPLLALTVVLWTFGEMVQGPISSAYVADLSPAHLRGRYQGAWGMTWSIGLILAPLLGTIIYSWNAALFWPLCGLLAALAALLVLLIKRRPQSSAHQPGIENGSPPIPTAIPDSSS